jgi:peptide/nickel transport system permease protein
MLRLIARRIAISIPLVFIVTILIFVLEQLAPGNIATSILGDGGTPAQYAALRQQLGLNDTLWVQYWHYLDQLFHGSLGFSLENGQSVSSILASRVAVTAWLVVLTVIISVTVGVSLGVYSATHRRVAGRAVDVISSTGFALPHFLLSVIVILIFAVGLGWLPSGGYVSFATSPVSWARSLILPVGVLSLHGIGVIAKTTRDSMRETLTRPFIRTLRSCGVGERSIIWKHALRGASNPILSVVGLIFITTLGGTVFVESVFTLPGLGNLALTAVLNHEVYEIEGIALYFTIIVVVVNLLIDIAYGILNPRERLTHG